MTYFDMFDKMLNLVRKRPALYFGENSIRHFQSFIIGYSLALDEYKIIEWEKEKFAADTPLPFWFFYEFTAKKFGYHESTAGWARIISDNVGDGNMESWKRFLEIYDEFRDMRITGCAKAVPNEENIKFSDELPIKEKLEIGNGEFKEHKIFDKPLGIYLLTLTGGYELFLCECEDYILADDSLLDKGKGILMAKKFFGDITNISKCDIHDIPCGKEIKMKWLSMKWLP
ncbi:MAG: hypothetical protein K2N72_00360 [Oscillospiraceae bacterium]|nr:hypothetical protein [Oscillospiraceae bacterium]